MSASTCVVCCGRFASTELGLVWPRYKQVGNAASQPIAPPDLLHRVLAERLQLEITEGKDAQDTDVSFFLRPLRTHR